MGNKETEYGGVDWIQMDWYWAQWRDFVNTVMNLPSGSIKDDFSSNHPSAYYHL
jgi:hypothetical protein